MTLDNDALLYRTGISDGSLLLPFGGACLIVQGGGVRQFRLVLRQSYLSLVAFVCIVVYIIFLLAIWIEIFRTIGFNIV